MQFGIMGAGAIGCYVGGRLLAAGNDVRFIGRASVVQSLKAEGLKVSDYDGYHAHISADRIRADVDVTALAGCDVVCVAVKSFDTEAAIRLLAPVLQRGALVVSLQNGVRNVALLASALPQASVVAGTVPFNVVRRDDGAFHRGTSGDLLLGTVEATEDRRIADVVTALRVSGVSARVHRNMVGIQWGKLVINLNAALNALAGIPLREELSQRSYRSILASLMAEALMVLRAARIRPEAALGVPPAVVPHVLRLPDPLFRLLAGAMLKIDPIARSSVWADLQRRRTTEIDYLNGEIVRLAEAHGIRAPLNAAIVEQIKLAEKAQTGSPHLSAEQLIGLLALR